MLIDTHAHIYLDQFQDDLPAVVERAREAGVERIVMPAIDVPSIYQAVELCERFEGLYAMAALHPSETKEATDQQFEEVVSLCDNPNVIAVGETGLDYYWDRSFDDRQHDFLRRHIRLAAEQNLPIIFHNREAFADLVRILEEECASAPDATRIRGIFHCFTGSAAQAAHLEALDFLVGIGGIVTFKNADLGKAVRDIPLQQIVLETDAPYLTPEPYRGKRNEPAYIRYVAEKLAAARELPYEEVASATTMNAERLFQL